MGPQLRHTEFASLREGTLTAWPCRGPGEDGRVGLRVGDIVNRAVEPHQPQAAVERPRRLRLGQAVRSGSLCGRRCLMLLLTCLFENPMSRRMVAEYAHLHLLMPTTAGAGCFPPAIAPRTWQSLPHALAQLGRCRYLAQQREQRIHLDQLADCHHLPLHVVEQLLVGNLLRLTCLVRRQVGATTCSTLYISRQNDI